MVTDAELQRRIAAARRFVENRPTTSAHTRRVIVESAGTPTPIQQQWLAMAAVAESNATHQVPEVVDIWGQALNEEQINAPIRESAQTTPTPEAPNDDNQNVPEVPDVEPERTISDDDINNMLQGLGLTVQQNNEQEEESVEQEENYIEQPENHYEESFQQEAEEHLPWDAIPLHESNMDVHIPDVQAQVHRTNEQPLTPEETVPQQQDSSSELLNESRAVDEMLHNDTDLRFQGAPWYERVTQQWITIIGLGGIGSWATFLIARMHPSGLTIYDMDDVETVNMSGQLYGYNELSRTKTGAIRDFVQNYADFTTVVERTEPFVEEAYSDLGDIVVCGLDNMNTRKAAFNAWKRKISELPREFAAKRLFIDGRMAAESIQVFCIAGDDDYYMQKYEEDWLFSDDEADSTVCSYKQTSFCAAMIGGIISNLIVNFCSKLNGDYRTLPFMTSYEADRMYLSTKV